MTDYQRIYGNEHLYFFSRVHPVVLLRFNNIIVLVGTQQAVFIY